MGNGIIRIGLNALKRLGGRFDWRGMDRLIGLNKRFARGRQKRTTNGYLQARKVPCRHKPTHISRYREGSKCRVPTWAKAGYPLRKNGRSSNVYSKPRRP